MKTNKIMMYLEFCTDFGDYIIYDNGVSLGYGVDFKETLHELTHEEAIERVLKLEFKDGKTYEAEEAKEALLKALRAGETDFDYEWNGNREIDIWILPSVPCVEKKTEIVEYHSKEDLALIEELENEVERLKRIIRDQEEMIEDLQDEMRNALFN